MMGRNLPQRDELISGIRARFSGPEDALRLFREFNAYLDRIHQPVIRELQVLLAQLTGTSFGSLERNEALAATVQQLLNRLGLRVQCPRCGHSATIQCRSVGNAKQGSFRLLHTINGQRITHVSSVTFPELTLVLAPPDRRWKTETGRR